MNHDYAHCLDYTKDCPKECFRAQLQKDLEERQFEFIGVPLTYSHLGGTDECKLVRGKKMRLIDADKLKDTISDTWILDRIDEQPTIVPVKWIPVSERMPEEDTDVLISYRYKEGEGDTSHVHIDITSYGDMYFGGRKVKGAKHWRQPFEYFTSNYEVVAWMPLPEPWKGEENV